LKRGAHRDIDRVVRNLTSVAVLGLALVYLASACGSEDDKKKDQNKDYNAGGDDTNAGGGSMKPDGGADATDGGATTTTGGATGVDGGTTGATGTDGGTTGDAGMAGSTGDSCGPGKGECDGDPETVCEQDLRLITSCGDCDTSCNPTNGEPSCVDGKCEFSCSDGYADCDGEGANGCEAALKDNAENCGACGRNCVALGSTCSVDKCAKIPLQQDQPFGSDGWASETWAFSPLGLLQTPFGSYAVRRYPLDGAATKVVWDSGNKVVGRQSLLVLGNDVYWSEQGTSKDDFTSAVYKKSISAPADELPTLAFVPEWKPHYLRETGGAFYWFSGDYQSGDLTAEIYTRAVDAPLSDHGTKIMTVDQGTHDGMEAFQVTSDALYWISNKALTGTAYELRTTPLSGGTPTVVPAVSDAFPTTAVSNYYGAPSLQAVGNTLYFNRDANDAGDGIYRYAAGDPAPTLIVKQDDVTSLLVDDSFVYYTIQNGYGLWRAKLTGSAGTKISEDAFAKIVGQDAQFVYAITTTCCNGDLYKVVK
jgi:hypothetical protein